MFSILKLARRYRIGLLAIVLFTSVQLLGQTSNDSKLEKWPVGLESDFALSALPPHLRSDATIYLLDPDKGFYVAHQGTNGFVCFVSRTEWEWAEFRKDLATPISFDAEGARTILPVVLDVAAMRASGKYTAEQVKDSVVDRIKKGVYKAPGRAGVSYMLAPMMRVYPSTPDIKSPVTVSMPHYMFYAPYVTFSDVGCKPDAKEGLMMVNPGEWVLGKRKGPYGFLIVPANEAEKAKILADNKELLKRLAEYKPYLKVQEQHDDMHH